LSSPEGAILEFPIKITGTAGEDVDALIGKLEGAKGAVGESEENAEAMEKIKGLLDGVDDKGIKNLKGLLSNPENFAESSFLSMLGRAGPYGAIAVAIIGLVIAAPELYVQIVKVLGQKGGPMNIDYRFNEDQQLSQEFDRELQFSRAIALNPVITVETKGFVVIDPGFEGNSLIRGNLARSARIGINESAYGYVHGI